MAGIIMGALGGLGEGMSSLADTMIKNDLETQQKLAVNRQDNDMALQRAKALEDYKIASANQQREAQSQRIQAAQTGVVNRAIAEKYASSDAAVAAADAGQTDAPLTREQRAVIEQAKQRDRDALMADAKTRTQAAIQTGDISPTEAAKLASSSEINQMKLDALMQRAEDRNSTLKEIAEVKTEAMRYGYELRLQAAQEKRLNGKVDAATTRMLVTSEDANIRASTSQLNMLNSQLQNINPTKNGQPNPAYESIKSQMDILRGEIAESKKRKLDLFKGLNIVPEDEGDDDTPAPAPAPAPSTAPAKKPPLSSFLK